MEGVFGLGCMRLSTAEERDEARAVEVIRAALDAGATVLDTADAYAQDDRERGHNERLVARALAGWTGDRARITVATKGGMRRPDGRWVPDGRARSLREACEASLEALGVERIDAYQLHAPDPRTPLATSVRALARLHAAGKIGAIGLCNVSVAQIEEARAIAPIASVQVALSCFDDRALRGGVVRHCVERGIEVWAHSPLGGPRRRGQAARHPVLARIAEARGVAPELVALAWLRAVHARITPLAGATRVESARSLALLADWSFTADERAALEEAFPVGALARPRATPARPTGAEVVLVTGIAGAGKSRLAERFVAGGYRRLNRDETGGRLGALVETLERGLLAGTRRFVMDNTYVTRAQRQPVVDAAQRHGAVVRCVWLDTPLPQAQINAALRLVRRYGELPTPERLRALRRRDPHAFDPRALFRMQRELEPPSPDEGFASVERVPFERASESEGGGRAIIVQVEGTLRASRSGARAPLSTDDLMVHVERRAILAGHRARGYALAGISWQPAIAEGGASEDDVKQLFDRTRAALDLDLDIAFCPHGGGPPRCWCRPPLPGLLVWLVERHRLDPAACLFVGSSSADRALAAAFGMRFVEVDDFFVT